MSDKKGITENKVIAPVVDTPVQDPDAPVAVVKVAPPVKAVKQTISRHPKFVQLADSGQSHYILKMAVDTKTNEIAGILVVDFPYRLESAHKIIEQNWGSDVTIVQPASRSLTSSEFELVNSLLSEINIKKFDVSIIDQAFGRSFGTAGVSTSVRLN